MDRTNAAKGVSGRVEPNLEEIEVRVYSTEAIVYQGKAKAVSSVNEDGPFDILPFHASFISLIKDLLTIHELSGGKKEFKIKSGVIKVHKGVIFVFLGVEGLG